VQSDGRCGWLTKIAATIHHNAIIASARMTMKAQTTHTKLNGISPVTPERSAGCQPAVSPTANRRGVQKFLGVNRWEKVAIS
jgi:hypothetical protein